VGEVTDGPDADATTGSGFEYLSLPTDPLFALGISPSAIPSTGVHCSRDLTSSVPEPYVGMAAVKPDWSVTNQT